MLTIWGRENSNNVRKVLWCAAELELSYTHINAGGAFGKVNEELYRSLNPNGLVPLLQDDDFVLWESNTIVRYLAAQYGKDSLWIAEPAARARGEKWMDWTGTSLAGPHRGVFISLVRVAPEQRDEKMIADSIEQCNALFAMVDAELAKQPWLGGAEFSTADIALGPSIYNLLNLDIKWNDFPHLQRWYQQLTRRPAFKKVVMIPLS